jgi:hypothetical protein
VNLQFKRFYYSEKLCEFGGGGGMMEKQLQVAYSSESESEGEDDQDDECSKDVEEEERYLDDFDGECKKESFKSKDKKPRKRKSSRRKVKPAAPPQKAPLAILTATVQHSATSTTFDIPRAASINSDNKPHKVRLPKIIHDM